MGNWLFDRVSRFISRGVSGDCTCVRCGGSGNLPQYSHVQNGVCFRCGGDGVDPSGALGPNQSLEYGVLEARLATIESASEHESIEHERHVDYIMREAESRSAAIHEEMGRLDPQDVEGFFQLQHEAEMDEAEFQAEMEAEETDYRARMEDLAWAADDEEQAYNDWSGGGYDDDEY